MKTLLIALVSFTATSAFAKSSSLSLAQLEKAAHEAQMSVENAEGCGFDASIQAGVLVLRMTEGNQQITVEVKQDEKITLVDKSKSGDTLQTYRMPGGSLEVLLADDAFNKVSMTDAQGESLGCEVDF